MNLIIRKTEFDDIKEIFDFRASYIEMNFDEFTNYFKANKDFWFVVYDNENLLGYCLGKKAKSDSTYMVLDEIATNVDKGEKYIRKGIGTKLIKEFEKEVWSLGFKTIGFGSGDNFKTEQFYLKNSYIPIEVVVRDNDKELERIKIADYDSGKKIQNELRSKYNFEEVNFIFEKYN